VLATLDNLQTKGVDKEIVGIRGVINKVDDGVVRDDVCSLLDGLVVVLRDGRDRLV
jgi:hypothetical protein